MRVQRESTARCLSPRIRDDGSHSGEKFWQSIERRSISRVLLQRKIRTNSDPMGGDMYRNMRKTTGNAPRKRVYRTAVQSCRYLLIILHRGTKRIFYRDWNQMEDLVWYQREHSRSGRLDFGIWTLYESGDTEHSYFENSPLLSLSFELTPELLWQRRFLSDHILRRMHPQITGLW